MSRLIRVLLAKTGLDTHDKGVRLIARGLRDAGGMEVIYTGLYRTLADIVEVALQEDVDVVGLSVHTGAHMTLFPELRALLDAKNAQDIIVIGGGVIPEAHRMALLESGTVAEIFGPGSSIGAITEWINDTVIPK